MEDEFTLAQEQLATELRMKMESDERERLKINKIAVVGSKTPSVFKVPGTPASTRRFGL
jgi:hypothetical protein